MVFWGSVAGLCFLSLLVVNRRLMSLPWLGLAILAGFRYRVGNDFETYVNLYELTARAQSDYIRTKELGYGLLVNLSEMLNGNAQLVFLIYALATVMIFYLAYQKIYGENYTALFLITLLFIPLVYIHCINIVRQMLAAAIFLYSIDYLEKRKFWYYLGGVCLASCFHLSAFLLLPMYWILNLKLTSRQGMMILGTVIVASVVLSPLAVLAKLFSVLGLPYASYFYSEALIRETGTFGKMVTYVSCVFVALSFSLFDEKKGKHRIIMDSMILMLLIRILALEIVVVNRFSIYFVPLFILFVIHLFFVLVESFPGARLLIFGAFCGVSIALTLIVFGSKANINSRYEQYAFNPAIFGDEEMPVQIYGNHKVFRYVRE